MTSERELLTVTLDASIGKAASANLWSTVDETFEGLERIPPAVPRTGLVLGYVQSGKTTAMAALMAEAVDRDFEIIIALLGTTNLLLDQNSDRLRAYLGIDERSDYVWVAMSNPRGHNSAKELNEWLGKGRRIFMPVLKNAKRIGDLAKVLSNSRAASQVKVLIIDDEADQASLNTNVRDGSASKVYSAIDELRSSASDSCFIQVTATPYAPLLLEESDSLFPNFVSFLQPGAGYTGGREFFVDHADKVIRLIPAGDEQASPRLPTELPLSLKRATWNFVVGAAALSLLNTSSTPISMLVHSSSRNDVQERYHFLLGRYLRDLSRGAAVAETWNDLMNDAQEEWQRLLQNGVQHVDEADLLQQVKFILGEIKLWLLNSVTAVNQVDWNVSPVHILVGGNKLDRGFTIEGLTVTYMNRPASVQIDTLEQRARAFGYRSEFLPYCQFFATNKSVKNLRDIVFTEYDLRAQLREMLSEGRTVSDWVREVGLLIPGGTKPTRDAVVQSLSKEPFGWFQLRRPSTDVSDIEFNTGLVTSLGLFDAPLVNYGPLTFRTLSTESDALLRHFLQLWRVSSYSPGWRHEELLDRFARVSSFHPETEVVLMELDAHGPRPRPRTRDWSPQEGFINLFQGRSNDQNSGKLHYPGDRKICGIDDEPTKLLLQVHRVQPRDSSVPEGLLTLALYIGDRQKIGNQRS